MPKDFKITVECNLTEAEAVDALIGFYKSGLEITPKHILDDQRSLRDLVRKDAKK